MARSYDAIALELAEVTDALINVQADDFAGRFELLTRRDELRAEAHQNSGVLDAKRPTQDVLAELAWARKRRDALIHTRSLVAGPSGHGVSGKMVKLSLKTDSPRGLQEVTERVAALEALLVQRGIDVEVALRD